MNRSPFLSKRSFILIVLLFIGACSLIYSLAYDTAKKAAVLRLNETQTIHAKQAARGIEEHFATWTGILTSLSKMDDIRSVNADGKRQMELFFDAHKDQIRSVTRMDEKGSILFTVPHREAIGSSISSQKHVQELLSTHTPIVSDVFKSVQGFDAIALHVPVFEGNNFKGSIAIVIDFQTLARRYLEIIKVNETGYAWVVSRDGTELYCPVPGHTGRSVFDNCREFPSIIAMAKEMLKGRSGVTTYTFNMISEKETSPAIKHAIYRPINLGNTFWSIVVASSEHELLASLASFRNRLLMIMGVIMVSGIAITLLGAKAWMIVRREEERSRAEAELRASEERYRHLFEQNPAPMLIFERGSWQLLAVNDAFLKNYGYSAEEALSMKLPDLYPVEEKKPIVELAARLQGHAYVGEWHHCHKNGAIRTIVATSHDLNYQGKTARIAVITDITELKQSEDALRESNERFISSFNNAPTIMAITKLETGECIDVNQRFVRTSGFSKEEVIGKTFIELGLITPAERERILNAMEANGQINKLELTWYTKEGKPLLLEYWGQILPVGGENRLLSICMDITEQRMIEQELFQAQKMESVGRLAAGVAHDFNNMLGVIIGHAELGLMRIEPDNPVHHDLQQIRDAADRSANITRQLLAFARKQVLAPKLLDLNDVVGGMIKMLQRLVGENIELHWAPGPELQKVNADPAHIDQLLANLCVNAKDAVGVNGRITIETSSVAVSEAFSSAHKGISPGDYVLLTVSDNGCGIDPAIMPHIFEPFYTTKDAGQGTGLGLATVFGIVKQNRGFIDVWSEPGQGTSFKIYLPAQGALSAPDSEKSEPLLGGTETILVVEDEAAILELCTSMLPHLGYTVLSAQSPAEALRIVAEHSAPIHLLLTDVIMPEMNGYELAGAISSRAPGIKVLYMSGYTSQEIHHEHRNDDACFIQKPFSVRLLAEMVRKSHES